MGDHHDSLFRKIFGRADQALPLCRAVLGAGPAAVIDWRTFAPVAAEFRNGRLQGRRADLLFAATSDDPDPEPLYLLLEHKFWCGRDAADQLLDYARRVRQRHREVAGKGEALVVPILLLCGPDRRSQPRRRHRAPLLDASSRVPEWSRSCWATTTRQRSGGSLPPPGTLVLLLQRFLPGSPPATAAAALRRWADLLAQVHAGDPGEDLEAVVSYILRTTELALDEIGRLFAQLLPDQEVLMSTAEKLIQQGHAKGRTEGRAEMLLTMLRSRFDAIPTAAEQRIRAAGIDQLDRWAVRLLTAGSLEELLAG